LATLPSGDVNATIRLEPETAIPIIFFEHGLFQFLYDFARLMAWSAPPYSPEVLSDDSLLAKAPRKYTMPPEASQFFVASLNAYVVDGSPIVSGSPLQQPAHNMITSIVLLNQMERFVMAHELAHIKLGHLEKPPSVQQEYEADAVSLSLI